MLLTVMKHGSRLPLTVFHGKVALMLLQGGDQHLARQGEETLLEPTRDRYRPLDECRDFVQQRIADQRAAPEFRRRLR